MKTRRDGSRVAKRLERLLERCRYGRLALVGNDLLKSRFGELARWQSARLIWTHRDLLDSERYGQAARFFLNDLYGDRDYDARDEGLARVSGIMIRVMPLTALVSIADGLEMHAVTQELDKGMIEMLFDEMGICVPIDANTYGEAYRRCNNRDGRTRQLFLIAKVGRDLDKIVHKSSIYHLIRMTHHPAHLAGFGDLQSFIERGFDAFRQMGGADEFLSTVTSRERTVHEAILANAPSAQWAPTQSD
jgi:hypothetical protein